MKIDINILPDFQKKKMKEEQKIGFTMKIVFSFILVLSVVNVVFALMQFILEVEYKAAQRSANSSSSNNLGKEIQLEKIFNDTNSQVAKISKISQNTPDWAKVLMRISDLTPDGIRVNQLFVEGTSLKISGFSKTRDDFLDFQNKLKNEGFQIPVDISNLVASSDFNFEFNINVPKEYLMRK
jgi:Tfp pilus assembly protein PilN